MIHLSIVSFYSTIDNGQKPCGLSHFVRILFLLDGRAAIVGGIDQFAESFSSIVFSARCLRNQ